MSELNVSRSVMVEEEPLLLKMEPYETYGSGDSKQDIINSVLENFTSLTEVTFNCTNCSSGNSTDELPTLMYYSLDYRIVGFLFVSLIFLVGLVGNIMVVVVVARTRSMHSPTNCYLMSLAVADCLVLISAPLPTLVEFFLPVHMWIMGHAMCSLMVFIQYLGINASSLSITAFSIERYVGICHPIKAQTMCTVKRAKKIIMGYWIFGICYNTPWLALTTVIPLKFKDGIEIEKCTLKLERKQYLAIYMTDLVIFYAIPLVITCILYGLIARILFSNTIPSTPGKSKDELEGKKKKKSISSSRIQVVKMLAVVVGLFAIFWLPYRVFVVYNSFAKKTYQDLWFLLFCRLMVYMNSSINPILYNAMSVKFRRAFKRLLSCGRRQELKTYMYSEVPTEQHHVHPAIKRLRITNGNGVNMPTTSNKESYL